MMTKKINTVLALIFLATSAGAEMNLKGHSEFGFYVGSLWDLEDYSGLNPDNMGIFGGRLGYFFCDSFSVEASFQRAMGSSSVGANWDNDAARLTALLHAAPRKHVRPFISLGGGYERNQVSGLRTEHDYGLQGGLGVRFVSKTGASLRVEGKYSTLSLGGVVADERQHNIEASLGVSWLFGPAPVELPVEAKKDSDGDGVADDMDQCPDTPAGTEVDEKGCPIPPAVEDSDGDNVADNEDECPNTPMGVMVDAKGCPLDSDEDGVADHQDKCPNTPAGETVDAFGCPPRVAKARGALLGVVFKSGSNELTPNSNTILREVAKILIEFPDFKVEVQGHTDSTGSIPNNMKLSSARAAAVKDFLVENGVDADRLTVVGFGPSVPVADNDTLEGRSKNRRVELKWLD